MLKIHSSYIDQIQAASSLSDLHEMVQKAIELEHSTIPPYLTAMYSLHPGTNLYIWKIIHSVVIEEMLHICIAANILNALGGQPVINSAAFVPAYPGPLPMGIGQGLIVGLNKYSPQVVKDVFMEIEEPENPLVFKSFVKTEYATIGAFYEALQEKINELADDQLPGEASRQVTTPFFPANQLFPIHTKADAIAAINLIVEQGEGTSTSPLDPENELAHYYRFEELYRGKQLVKDPAAPNGFSFSGPPIPFDATAVFPLFPNTKTAMLPEGSAERRRMDEFNASYFALLNGLHRTFNGDPTFLSETLGLMYDIKLQAAKLCATPFPGKQGYTLGPSFEYMPYATTVADGSLAL